MTKRMRQSESRREPELGEILDLGNFQEAIELLVEKPLRTLSDEQRSQSEARFGELEKAVASVEACLATWQTKVDGRLGALEATTKSEESAGSQRDMARRQEAAALQAAVARLQQDLDQLHQQQGQLVSFAEADAQQVRAAADRDRLWSRLMVACLGVLLMVLIVVEFIRT